MNASRLVFAEHGYADASLDDIARRAGVTKGALYHHFDNKAALLEAVYVELELEIAAKVKAAIDGAAGGGAMARIAAAFDAFFEASEDPIYQRIVLRDAPGVLGRTKGRGLDHAIGLDLVVALIEDMRREEIIGNVPIAMAARIFLAAVSEVAMAAAHSDDPQAVRREGTVVLMTIIEGVRLATTR
jgi:AcrR family transcriptional regulator